MSSSSKVAQKQWELENDIKAVDPDSIYTFDEDKHQVILKAKPWKQDPKYFKKIKISALAMLKMVMHARSGVPEVGIPLEVMGLMQGKIEGDTFIVQDSFALPVTGTETRVDAGSSPEAIEYTANYKSLIEKVGRNEATVGWYHSHPGFGVWMSGVDCTTQSNIQKYQDPFVSVVIDPIRTVGAGKVVLDAFRTFPEGYKNEETQSYGSIPLDKIEDFGVYASRYYKLSIEYFKSSTDEKLLNLLWNKYWTKTLSVNVLIAGREYIKSQIEDVATKTAKAESESSVSNRVTKEGKDKQQPLSVQIVNDSAKLSTEVLKGEISQAVKYCIFMEGHKY